MPVVNTLGGRQVVVVDAIGGTAYLGLPSTEELYRKYHIFRTVLFDNLLPTVDHPNLSIEWSNKLTSAAGKCWAGGLNPNDLKYLVVNENGVVGSQWKIRLSTKYHAKFPEQIWCTLAHEMIHMIDDPHVLTRKKHAGPRWKYWMDKINDMRYVVHGTDHPIIITVYSHERADTEIKWEYTCTVCNHIEQRHKRVRLQFGYMFACPVCKSPVREKSLKKFRERS